VRTALVIVAATAITIAIIAGARGGRQAPRRSISAVAPGSAAPALQSSRIAGTSESAQAVAEQAQQIPGRYGLRPELAPLSPATFNRPIARYRRYALRQAASLARAARAGNLRAARDRFLRVGAAYGGLGRLDDTITAALAHRDTRTLVAAAARVPAVIRHAELTPLDYATRAHEILEDAQRDRFDVPDTRSALAATREVIGTLRSVLAGRGDALQQVDYRLGQLGRALRAPAGRLDRERIQGTLGAALESLALVPGALETSLPPASPRLP
jgi:high-affinity iron transporter